MGIHYLTSIERNLKNKKKPMPIRITNSKNIMNNVSVFKGIVAMKSNFGGISL